MKSFLEYVEESSENNGYVAVKVSPVSAKQITDKLGLINHIPIDKLHCTIIYDKSKPNIHFDLSDEIHSAIVTGCEILGDAIVLNIQCPSLNQRYNELVELGFKSDFADYRPHISIRYDKGNFELMKAEFNLFKCAMFSKIKKIGKIYLGNEYNEVLKN